MALQDMMKYILLFLLTFGMAQASDENIFVYGFDPATDQCGQQQTADVYFQVNSHTIVGVTKYEFLLGKASAQSQPVLFPGISGSPYINNMGKTAFISSKFTVASDMIATARGTISLGETFAGHPISISISKTCGFFVPPAPNCYLRGLGNGQGLTWKMKGALIPTVACELEQGQTYFLNIMFTDSPPVSDRFNCGVYTCKLPLTNSIDGV
ncbi:MAG TPA: hypothetical protein VIY48_01560 [Candidatus Paceibacterota bacterium]